MRAYTDFARAPQPRMGGEEGLTADLLLQQLSAAVAEDGEAVYL